MNVFAGIMIVVFFMIGIVSSIKWLVLKFVATGNNGSRLYAVMLRGNSADIELQLAMETLGWDHTLSGVKAYAVDCGISEECYDACSKMCNDGRFKLLTVDEFSKMLKIYSE